ncbi:DUF4112 domain-containing protein [Phenylobacterium immobile]|uniref:DUF4112 domain-containing protein n=1 Tax=Phenylobacterium immobile TaxID=21 RepID=UPI000A89D49B|nr:DUF4112 domain-containing protein [Phenylobacterium immobile]
MDKPAQRAHQAWRSAERIKQLSDRVVAVGPFGLGVDALINWVGGGLIYSLGAGALLIHEAVQARAGVATLARMGAYLAFDTATSSIPIAGWAVDALFPGHLMAAKALQKDIEARHGPVTAPEPWRLRWRRRRASHA